MAFTKLARLPIEEWKCWKFKCKIVLVILGNIWAQKIRTKTLIKKSSSPGPIRFFKIYSNTSSLQFSCYPTIIHVPTYNSIIYSSLTFWLVWHPKSQLLFFLLCFSAHMEEFCSYVDIIVLNRDWINTSHIQQWISKNGTYFLQKCFPREETPRVFKYLI